MNDKLTARTGIGSLDWTGEKWRYEGESKSGEMDSNSGSCWQVAKVFQRIFMRMSLWDFWGTVEFSLTFSTTVPSIYLWYTCLLFCNMWCK